MVSIFDLFLFAFGRVLGIPLKKIFLLFFLLLQVLQISDENSMTSLILPSVRAYFFPLIESRLIQSSSLLLPSAAALCGDLLLNSPFEAYPPFITVLYGIKAKTPGTCGWQFLPLESYLKCWLTFQDSCFPFL